MRGIISAAGYVPYRRLQRSAIAQTFGSGGGKGTRSVAGFDQDTTTLGVEAARLALRSAPPGIQPSVWFATTEPAYLDKTNATAIHAVLRLDSDRPAYDLVGSVRSGVAALRAALGSDGPALAVTADLRTGLPTSGEESQGGDGGAALLVGSDADGPVIAELIGVGASTDEFTDRWRVPGEHRSRLWEEKFGETRYVPLAEQAFGAALKAAELSAGDVDRAVVTGSHPRAVASATKKLGLGADALVDDLSSAIGVAGTAHPALVLAHALETARPGQVVALVVLSDGADVLLFRTTPAIEAWRPTRTVADQVAAAADLPYGKFLSWKGVVTVEPPRRPEPSRPSSSAANRNEDWKYGFVGSKDRTSGAIHLPPQRVSMEGGAIDDMEPIPMAEATGTVTTFTIDRLAYSPSPPIVFAVVDFDGGGRLPLELTDCDADEVGIGTRVEMTFRRLFTADGIHNYFWKGRPIRA
jgi:hydroxymethylglutaryl-CoA synthase